MRKLFAIITALTLVFALTACNNESGTAEAAPAETATEESGEQANAVSPEPAATDSGADRYALDEPMTLRFASSGSGGSDYADIGTIVSFLTRDGVLPAGSQITQETISGGTSASGYLIEAGMADVCRGQNAMSALRGMEGREPYSQINALFAAGGNSIVMQVASPDFVKKSGYSTIEEIIENQYPATLCTEDIGSSDYTVVLYLFEIYGMTMEDYEAWGGKIVHTDNNTASEMLQDGSADIMICHTTLTSSLITELTMTTDVTLSSFGDKIIDGFLGMGFAERYIPAGTFDQFPEDARSAFIGTSIIVHEDMENKTAYNLTKLLMENREELGESAATMRNLTYEMAVDESVTVVPLHPGAVEYFQDIGVLDESGNYIGG